MKRCVQLSLMVCLLSYIACSGGPERQAGKDSLIGTWKVSLIETNGVDDLNDDMILFDFAQDGSFTFTGMVEGKGGELNGKWNIFEDNSIIVHVTKELKNTVVVQGKYEIQGNMLKIRGKEGDDSVYFELIKAKE